VTRHWRDDQKLRLLGVRPAFGPGFGEMEKRAEGLVEDALFSNRHLVAVDDGMGDAE